MNLKNKVLERPGFSKLSVKGTSSLFLLSSRYLEEPTMIAAFNGKQAGKHVVHIACGSTYSAAITADGELYTWGRGNYGRLGHGELHLEGGKYLFTELKPAG